MANVKIYNCHFFYICAQMYPMQTIVTDRQTHTHARTRARAHTITDKPIPIGKILQNHLIMDNFMDIFYFTFFLTKNTFIFIH